MRLDRRLQVEREVCAMGERVDIGGRDDCREQEERERRIRDDGAERGGECEACEGRERAEEHPAHTGRN